LKGSVEPVLLSKLEMAKYIDDEFQDPAVKPGFDVGNVGLYGYRREDCTLDSASSRWHLQGFHKRNKTSYVGEPWPR